MDLTRERLMTDDLLDMIREISGQRGGRPAVIQAGGGPDHLLSWDELFRSASAVRASAEARTGSGPTAILLPGNDPRIVPLLFGLIGNNGVLPISPLLPVEACAHLLEESGASELIFDPADPVLSARGREAAARAGARVRLVPTPDAFDAPVGGTPRASGSGRLLIHTSGSTGFPRIAQHEVRRLLGVADAWSAPLYGDHPVLLSLAPLFSAAGLLGGILFCARQGGTLLIPGGGGPASPEFQRDLPRIIRDHEPEVILAIPPVLRRLSPLSPLMNGRLRALVSGGMLLSDPAGSGISAEFGVPYHHLYASSEMSVVSVTTYLPNGNPIGQLRPEVASVRIENPDTGAPCPIGEAGEVRVSSPHLPENGPYLSPRPQDMGGSGFRTGDFGMIDRTGRLVLTGRMSDLVKYNGRRVPMLPVEEAAHQLTGFPCACVQGPDPDSGEAIILFIEGAPPEDLTSRLRELLPDPACAPRRIIQLPELPLAGLGKPDRSALTRISHQRIAEDLLEAAGVYGSVLVTGTIRSGFTLEIRSEATEERISAALRYMFGSVRIRPPLEV
jgi:acyl-CoA synthetase (AMP-forming)/AMP-acid ligase II